MTTIYGRTHLPIYANAISIHHALASGICYSRQPIKRSFINCASFLLAILLK